MVGATVIDTHVHFYDPTRPQGVPWPRPEEPLLYRQVLPRHWRALADRTGVAATAAEIARRQGKSNAGKSGSCNVAGGLALAGALLAGSAWGQSLPLPCAGGACGVNPNPTAFVTSGAASYAINGTQGIVSQTTNKAILNWQSFNVGSGHSMEFIQPGAGAAALNHPQAQTPGSRSSRPSTRP